MLARHGITAIVVTAAVLILAACGGEPPPDSPPNNPSDNTAFGFDLPGYAPSSGASGALSLAASLSGPFASNSVTLHGQLLPIAAGASDGSVTRFAIRVEEGEAILVEEFKVHVRPNVYDFYVVLSDGNNAYGGYVTNWQILNDPRNLVKFTMFPLADPEMDVRSFRESADAATFVDLAYDPALVGTTDPKLTVTFADQSERVFVIDTALAGGSIRIFGVSTPPPHRFYYGSVVVGGPVDATNDPTPLLQYTIDDPCFEAGTCGETVLINGVSTTARNGDPLTGLDDGTYELRVIFTDENNDASETISMFTIDATPPTVIVEPPPAGGGDPIEDGGTIGSGDGAVTVSSDEGGSLAVYLDPDPACIAELDAGSDGIGPCDGFVVDNQEVVEGEAITTSLTGLTVGAHSLYLVAVDGVGNQSVEVISFTVVPSTAPLVTVGEPATSLYGSLTVPLAYTVTGEGDPLLLQVNVAVERLDPGTGTWSPAGGTVVGANSLTVTGDGHYRVTVSATNEANLTAAVTRNFAVDTTAPQVAIVQPAHESTVFTGKPQLEVNATEQSAFNVRIFLFPGELREYGNADWLDIPIDGQLQQQNGDPLMDGRYTVVVELTDAVALTTVEHATFTVNAAGPQVGIINPTNGAVLTNGQANLKYNVRDASHVAVWLASEHDPSPSEPLLVRVIDPVQPVPRTYQDSIDVPVDGVYTITVVAKDISLPGVTSEDSVSFIADGFKPAVQVSSPAPGSNVFQPGMPVSVSFSASNATQYQVHLGDALVDSGALAGSPTIRTVPLGSFVEDGWRHVTVTVSDGLHDATDSAAFAVDGTAPVVTVLAPEPQQHFTGGSVTLLYRVSEAVGVREERVWLDGVELDGVSSGDTLHELAPSEDPYVLEVEAVDLAGNTNGRVGVSFFVDAEKPDHHHGRRRRASCMHTPIAGDRDALQDLLRCVRHRHKGHHHGGH